MQGRHKEDQPALLRSCRWQRATRPAQSAQSRRLRRPALGHQLSFDATRLNDWSNLFAAAQI